MVSMTSSDQAVASSTETRTFHHIKEQPVIGISMVILLYKGNMIV